ncbi:MAG: CYTH domain-containing protein [Lachnospiraceae bacterium]|nr:CYTH domain-containing protein [Lachnospiraceae bacterium]
MEIERKWLVNDWPEESAGLPLLREEYMRQGYIALSPTVRIREEAVKGGPTDYVLCFKSSGTLSRKEIEISVSKDKFDELEDLIGIPLIPKTRRVYQLPDGLHLEVNLVDEGMATEFMYAEVEYQSEEEALAWDPAAVGLAGYLCRDVTADHNQTMGAYWAMTRLKE